MPSQHNTVRNTVRVKKMRHLIPTRYRTRMLEPVEGLEPTTSCLQNSCSAN